ncbi:MAG TPA: ATP-binding protein [Steroidobacteraceae bacterium]|nr:ATP-binding protein [Steroidobacteraceae bacterium]
MIKFVGRKIEREKIHAALTSSDPELVAVWGRRRVGKTFLIRYGREPVADHFMEITGQRNGALKVQLKHFSDSLSKAFHQGIALSTPATWDDAFQHLAISLAAIPMDGKPITLFFDEAPWLDARRSGFLDAFEYFWNTIGVKNERLKVFVCGSAASWIINKIVNGKGGWHRRITRRMLVLPFNLSETFAYLTSRQIQLSKLDILRLYMILGGIPYYLSLMQRGESVATFTDRLFFSESPDLQGEFDELFDSLFNNSAVHKKIMSVLTRTKSGLTRSEITAKTSLPSGGSLNRYIDNLESSGFIEAHLPLAITAVKDKRYRVCDMFTVFHLRWLTRKAKLQSWQAIVASQHYKSWCGHAFEMLSWNHAGNIAHALGVARSDYSVTCASLDNSEGSAQIDLLFDVRGGAIYLFELKFSDHPYVMVAAEAKQLQQRRRVLEREFNGSRSTVVCLLTPCGAKRNPQLDDVVDLVLDEAAILF